jgi:putative sigma-54 modulation protein
VLRYEPRESFGSTTVKTTVTARHVELTGDLREQVEGKLRRLDRVAHPDAEAHLELIGKASHASGASHVAEVTLVSSGNVLRSTSTGPTALAAVDGVLDKLERQMVRTRERPRRLRERSTEAGVAASQPGEADIDGRTSGAAVVKTKRFDLVPMFAEDAAAQMDELGHAFFVFLDAETNRVAVVYRRRDGNYGVIDPVVTHREGRR